MFRKLKYLLLAFTNLFTKSRVIIISERADWVINEIAKETAAKLNRQYPGLAKVAYSTYFLKNKILHFSSINTLVDDGRLVKFHNSNRAVLTWYHVIENDKRMALIPEINKIVSFVHTACQLTYNKLLASGFPANKLVLIPESIDLNRFRVYSTIEKDKIKNKLNLPSDKMIIGSFQKDGVGWKEGNGPKLIKGPDIFCSVVENLVKNHPVHVLLTGPARGYVKNRLRSAGISFTHIFFKNYYEVVDYYNVLDLYLITSREEGGPKAILESWACGVPLVSTAVGMALDVIINEKNGFLAPIGSVEKITNYSDKLINDPALRAKITFQALADVKKHDLAIMAKSFYEKFYQPFLR